MRDEKIDELKTSPEDWISKGERGLSRLIYDR